MVAGKADPVQNSAQGSEGKTRDALADIAGVSHDTIAKVDLSARVSFREFRNDNRHGVGYFSERWGQGVASPEWGHFWGHAVVLRPHLVRFINVLRI
jgi:hypothetical protein